MAKNARAAAAATDVLLLLFSASLRRRIDSARYMEIFRKSDPINNTGIWKKNDRLAPAKEKSLSEIERRN